MPSRPLAPHVAAAMAASGSPPAAQPKRPAGSGGLAPHVQAAVAAGRGGGSGVQARLAAPAASARRPAFVQAMQIQQDDEDPYWNLPGFLFDRNQGFYIGQASKQELALVVDEENEVPQKTYLYLGAGDLSAPSLKAKKHKGDKRYRITATELQSHQDLIKTGGQSFKKNLRRLLKLGHNVAFEVDGVQNTRGTYDRIIFQNPHTGQYGSADNDSDDADMNAIASNANLLAGIFKAARGHLEAQGLLEITICGFPYISSTWGQRRYKSWRQGLGLENKAKANKFAGEYGWQVASLADKGTQWVRRNNGQWFQATVYKLKFRQVG